MTIKNSKMIKLKPIIKINSRALFISIPIVILEFYLLCRNINIPELAKSIIGMFIFFIFRPLVEYFDIHSKKHK